MQEPTLLPLTGFLVTFVIDIINRKIADSDVRRLVAYVFCAVWGIGINVIEHNATYAGLTLQQIVMSFLVSIGAVIGFSQLTYSGWEDSKIREDLKLNAKKQ